MEENKKPEEGCGIPIPNGCDWYYEINLIGDFNEKTFTQLMCVSGVFAYSMNEEDIKDNKKFYTNTLHYNDQMFFTPMLVVFDMNNTAFQKFEKLANILRNNDVNNYVLEMFIREYKHGVIPMSGNYTARWCIKQIKHETKIISLMNEDE